MRRDLTDEEIQAILDDAYSRPAPDFGPSAVQVHYDAERQRVMVEYDNGCLFGFPVNLVRDTEGAPAELLSHVEILSLGRAVGWRNINASVDLNGVMMHAFRAKSWAGRYLGAVSSPAKAEAARRNGRKGGRPRKKAEPEQAAE
jgi:hypothetical protein